MEPCELSQSSPFPNLFTIRVQTILYMTESSWVERSLEYLDAAARNAKHWGLIKSVQVSYGDCSPNPVFDAEALRQLCRRFPNLEEIDYDFFGANLGHAGGHNRLLAGSDSDLTVILNPDGLVFPNLFREFLSALGRPAVGLVEARQIPIEHAKDYDRETGETSWASGACAIVPTRIFKKLQGFDAENFFLYCDDVDFSWRVRLAGYKVIHQCSAAVFHDKRLDHEGKWLASEAEKYYSAEAALLLAYKYSRSDLTERYLHEFRESGSEPHIRAAGAIELRRKTGRMPLPIDPDHAIGQFIDGAYARHRFVSRVAS